MSPRLFIALPFASIYNDIPLSDAEKSRTGVPWNARVLVISYSTSACVVRLIEFGTSVKKTVAGHHAPSIHCICCNMMESTAGPSRRYFSGTIISIEIEVPRLARKSIDSGISLISISVLAPASLLMSSA